MMSTTILYSQLLHDRLRKRDKDSDAMYVRCLLDEIERLQAERRWIPVSERLPEDTGEVWIKALGMNRPELGSYVYQTTGEAFGIYCKPCFYAWRAGDWTDKVTVTHWMPLPSQPEEEK